MKFVRIGLACLLFASGVASLAHAGVQKEAVPSYSAEAATASSAAPAEKPMMLAGYVWTCRAESQFGWGEGIGYSPGQARNVAMYQCRINTPYGDVCFVVSCW